MTNPHPPLLFISILIQNQSTRKNHFCVKIILFINYRNYRLYYFKIKGLAISINPHQSLKFGEKSIRNKIFRRVSRTKR